MGVLIGLAVLVLLIYLSVLLSLATPAYVMEGIGVVAALTRSAGSRARRLVAHLRRCCSSSGWRVSVVGGVLGASAGPSAGRGGLAGSVAPPCRVRFLRRGGGWSRCRHTFTTPFLAGVTGLLYVDQRIRRERFDLQLATWANEARR